MKKSNVYTRTGDAGTTSLVGGIRVPKTHPRIEAYGTVDELNAHVGLLAARLPEGDDREHLVDIQRMLFRLGAVLATETPADSGTDTTDPLGQEAVETLEHLIDATDEQLPPWRTFILPGGTEAAAQCHVCRTVCRRAERCVWALAAIVAVPVSVTLYLNRLSDYFFVLSRKINFVSGVSENIWRKN